MKMKSFICKYKWIILLCFITIVRLLATCNLPSYFFNNLTYDDVLMLKLSNFTEWLGHYHNLTLVKGPIYPLFLRSCDILHCSYSFGLTFIYIGSCIFITYCCKSLFKKQKYLILLYLLLLWNPLSYSMELFQRLYRNSLSLSETLIFFGCIIKIVSSKKNNMIYEILLGIISSIMLLTREDNIWIYIILFLVFTHQIIRNKKIKNIFLYTIPMIIIILTLNFVSFVNYRHYKIYTYNELKNSAFSDAYINLLKIKDDKKINQVSITKQTLYKLADCSTAFGITKSEIDDIYESWSDQDTGEINNGNIIWALRQMIYMKFRFKNGLEANNYWEKLSRNIEELFQEGKLETEWIIPSVFVNTPSFDNIKTLPERFLQTIYYTSTYQNIRTISSGDIQYQLRGQYHDTYPAYKVIVNDYHNSENVSTFNITIFNIIKTIYILCIPFLSLIALYHYFQNIKNFHRSNILIATLLLISYLIIIGGIIYTDVTAFKAIRYIYLGPIYLIQIIFVIIMLEGVSNERTNHFNALSK